ncbi:hypothetical protein CY35_04G150700 [Sphagnum magellanicum]|nr:hypothetical protein CY35_04G150700 [Sphagnum magellanicum]
MGILAKNIRVVLADIVHELWRSTGWRSAERRGFSFVSVSVEERGRSFFFAAVLSLYTRRVRGTKPTGLQRTQEFRVLERVWTPVNNLKFETLSYLPPLTPDQVASQIDYMLANKWIPCLEFDLVGTISRTNFQDTMTVATGPCGSCPCSDAQMLPWCCARSRNARRRTLEHISGCWDSIM